MHRRVIGTGLVLLALWSFPLARREAVVAADANTIQGSVSRSDGRQSTPLANAVLLLRDETGSVVEVTATNAAGEYRFEKLAAGVYRVVAAELPGVTGGDALPGAHAVKIDGSTLQVTMVPDAALYAGNNFVKNLAQVPSRRTDRLLALGDVVKGPFTFSDIEPLELDPGDSIIRRVTDDGSLFVLDPSGAALLRLGGGKSDVLLDTTARDAVDGVTLTRLLRAETSRDGVTAVVALRADNTRGVYRLAGAALQRVALFPGDANPPELGISDGGQVAFVASVSSGARALFQTSGGGAGELLREGQRIASVSGGAGDAVIDGISNLTANDAGDLAVLVTLSHPDQSSAGWAVLRKTGGRLAVVAQTFDPVATGRGAPTGTLISLVRPQIGPDGTVIFMGAGPFIALGFPSFVNFYAGRPGQRVQPLLRSALWDPRPESFDYDLAGDGTAAVRATPLTSLQPELSLVTPAGAVLEAAVGRPDVQPAGRPAFGPGGLLFFQARNPAWGPGRTGRPPVGLFRFRPGEAGPTAVAIPGQALPGRPGTEIHSIPQRPAVSGREVTFAGLFGGSDRFQVPTAGLFRAPLGGTLAEGSLVAAEGSELPSLAQVVALRDFYYTGEGALILDTYARRGLVFGQLVATVAPGASTASAARALAAAAPNPVPLLVKGDDLGSGRKLKQVLGRLVALGNDRYVFVAQFSQGPGAGEGLFTIDRAKQVQAVAVNGDPALGPGLMGTRFLGFGETPKGGSQYVAYTPAVSASESVVFKARLERVGTATSGLFQWSPGTAPTAVALADVALTTGDLLPYDLQRWAAGAPGRSYFLEQHQTPPGVPLTRLFERSSTGLAPLAVPGQTPVAGRTPAMLNELTDFVVNRAGEVFVQGTAGGAPGLLELRTTGLVPLVLQGQAVPPMADGTLFPRLAFEGSFALAPESARGDMFFRAGVWQPGSPATRRRGIFHRTPDARLETVLVENLAVGGARDLIYTIARAPGHPLSTQAVAQTGQVGSGTVAFAARDSAGRWAIYRSRELRDPATGRTLLTVVLVAQEGQRLADGTLFGSLDPSLLLGRPIDSGPVFRLSAEGDVAFLASDGQRWAIYRFSDRA